MRIYKPGFILFALLLAAAGLRATTRKVLFIGNSYIYTNNMPLMLQSMATALGDTLIYDESDPGGHTFEMHSTNTTTIAKIFSQKWDIVVLQEQSQLPSFSPAEVDTQVYPFAHVLDSMIRKTDTCTQTMFLMTWGRASGDASNCPFYPPVCTYAGMQHRLRESYMEMTQDNHAIVAPVGAAWKAFRDSFSTPYLYQPDDSHPVVAGSYLEACVLYASIFHKPTYGCSYTSGLTTSDVQKLQRFADRVTLDSLAQWQQFGHYPSAGFSSTPAGMTYTFSSKSPVSTYYNWSFGDGGTDTATSPVHTYPGIGTYTVTHTASNVCFTETITDVLYIGTTGFKEQANQNTAQVNVVHNGSGNVIFMFPPTQDYQTLEVLDGNGKRVRLYTVTGPTLTDNFVPGFYLFRAFSADGKTRFLNKLVVY